MKFTSPAGRVYEWDKPNPPTQEDIDAIVKYDASLAPAKSATEKYSDMAGDIAAETGIALGGQVLGAETGPFYFAIAPAAGAYGNYVKQQRQIERGERKDLSYGELITAGLINAIPAQAMFKTGATVGATVTRQALLGTGIEAGREAISRGEQMVEEKRFPTLDDFYSVLQKGSGGMITGAAAGGGLEMAKTLTPAAKALWGRLAGKTESEANSVLRQVANEGTDGERKAAAEIIDTVGQELGLVRSAKTSAQESASVFQRAIDEGQSPQAAAALRERYMAEEAAIRANAQRARQFHQARAEELQQSLRGGQLAGEESTVLTGSPERTQLNMLDTRPGNALRERERLRQRMGVKQEDMPTTEDVLNEFSAIRGIGSKQAARRMNMEGGNISTKAMAGVAGAGLAGVGIASALASQPKFVEVETPAGVLRYDASKYSDEEIDRDVANKVADFRKMQAAGDALALRAQVANSPDNESAFKLMLDWSNGRRAAAAAAKTFIQAAGSRLPAAGRMASGVAGEYASGAVMGEIPTPGQVAQSAIQSAPRGTTSLGSNLVKFGAAGVVGEAAREAIDADKVIDFRTASEAAALGGLRAVAMRAAETGSRAKSETSRQRRDLGEIEMYNDGKRLGIVLDPGARTNPDIKQVAAVKLSGGTTPFQEKAARVNTPIVMEKVKELAGSTGNPQTDEKLSPSFFIARRLQEGRIYDQISSLPDMKQKVEDWKQANSTAISEYKKWSNTGKNENLVAAREARARADDKHLEISNSLRRMGQGNLINELDAAAKKIGELHTLEAAVGPTYKITDAKVWGQMYRDNERRYQGDLKSLMRIAASQPGVLQDASAIPIKGASWQDLVQVPMLRQFMASGAGQSMFNQQRYGTMDPSFLAQMAGLGAQNVANEAYRPTPLR